MRHHLCEMEGSHPDPNSCRTAEESDGLKLKLGSLRRTSSLSIPGSNMSDSPAADPALVTKSPVPTESSWAEAPSGFEKEDEDAYNMPQGEQQSTNGSQPLSPLQALSSLAASAPSSPATAGMDSGSFLLEEGVLAPQRSHLLPPLQAPMTPAPSGGGLIVSAISLQHQLSPRGRAGGPLLQPLEPATSSLTFDTFASQQHSRILEATRAQDSYAAALLTHPAAPPMRLPSVRDDPTLREAMIRTPNTRLLISILQAEAYANDTSQMVSCALVLF